MGVIGGGEVLRVEEGQSKKQGRHCAVAKGTFGCVRQACSVPVQATAANTQA